VPDDLWRQTALGPVAVSPDGRRVAFTVRTVVEGRDDVGLWLVPFAGGPPVRVGAEPSFDYLPRFSRDGSKLAFLSSRDARTVVRVHDLASGSTRDVPDAPEGVFDLDWHPDGRHLVVAAPDAFSPEVVEEPTGLSPTAYLVHRRGWRRDGKGCVLKPTHVHVVSLSGGPSRRLTDGPWSASQPRISPDGAEVAFVADLGSDSDIHPYERLYRVPFAGGDVATAWTLPGPVVDFAWEPDGGCLCRVAEQVAVVAPLGPLHLYRVDADGHPTELGGELGESIGVADWCDHLDWGVPESVLGPVQPVCRQGRLVPFRLDADPPVALIGEDDVPVVYSIGSDGSHVAAVVSTECEAPVVGAVEDGRVRVLFDGREWLRGVSWPRVEELLVEGPNGAIRTFVLSPADAAERPMATVLSVHGGPTGQWSATPPLEAVMLTGAGFRVALPNIHGSTGEGPDWAAVGPDVVAAGVAECVAVAEELVRRRLADPRRLGALGVSYGGSVVNALLTATDRFAAAVSEAGGCNDVTAWGICDLDPAIRTDYLGVGDTTTPEGVEALWRSSPLRLASRITTPLLLLQGDEDRRCPAADSEQLFSVLRQLGREVEYVVYPESDHGFSLCGRPDRRVDRYRRMLEWFLRFLGEPALQAGGADS